MKKTLTKDELRGLISELKAIASSLPEFGSYGAAISEMEDAYIGAFGHLDDLEAEPPQDSFTKGIAAALILR